MQINSVLARAIEISGKRSKDAFEIRRTASRVIPRIADFFAGGRIKGERVAVTIKSAIERHPGIDAVIESALEDVGELGVSRCGEHAPVPHHVSNRGAAFAIREVVWQLVGITESLAVRARADSAGDVHFGFRCRPREC